jgi:uncharacterized protein
MYKNDGALLYSASDLVNFLGCAHATVLDLRNLSNPVAPSHADEQTQLLQEKGLAHEQAYLRALHQQGLSIAEIPSDRPLRERAELTRKAMNEGAQVIYQGALFQPPWHGYSDFLLRVDNSPSKLGSHSYEVADTKLSRSAKPKHVIQLCVYSALIGAEQGRLPHGMYVVLGDNTRAFLKVSDFIHYYGIAADRFMSFTATPPISSTGEPCGHCEYCRWIEQCENDWETSDHLGLIANITRAQMKKLRDAGLGDMRALQAAPNNISIPKLQSETLQRLQSQARLQMAKRQDGENRHEILSLLPGKGFSRLPRPDDGDLFFDMEGDPLYEDGKLEYLFGFVANDGPGERKFTCFWAHDRPEEKKAFENAVDFITTRLKARPNAHVYHYGSYEETALKNLAMFHGTREVEIDNLLRGRKLVDLLKVVREAVRVSEPSYSIKNLEAFYAEKRAGDVKSAGQSIVVYEKWRRLGDDSLLKEITDYNEFDCRSTAMCRDWLLGLRPAGVAWFSPQTENTEDTERSEKRREAEAKVAQLSARLLEGIDEKEKPWRRLVGHLLEFHRREAKPKWWAAFNRQDMTDEELVDDAECIGKLARDPDRQPYRDKRSTVHSFRFPAQDFKMRVGGNPLRSGSLEPAGEIVELDENNRVIALKIGPSRSPLPDILSIIPEGPIGDQVLREAVHRYAEAVAGRQQNHYAAVTGILRKERPRIDGLKPNEAIVPPEAVDQLAATIDAIGRLTNSHMLIQGPPGTGKTYTSSHAIVELLKRGKRIGISSNSHKAINNLLQAVEKEAGKQSVRFKGVKKSSSEDQDFDSKGFIVNTTDNEVVERGGHQLVAGTAWLFTRQAFDQAFDYLFIDEAGQVSLANVVAMGVCAKNIVLVGDQMQLSQPIQGTHPGDSGLSALEYLLEGAATVPPDQGIFLATSQRMNPALCRFISEAVYDGRLQPDIDNARQQIVITANNDPAALTPAGLRFVEVEHEGCMQKSEEEAERVRQALMVLLDQQWTDRLGTKRKVTIEDILVVTPYNMQVDLLKRNLPQGARVGTVDKFQGQEAAVVLISMVTSSGEDMPRNLEFLFSRNRLNVAISRARCLAVIFASPRLLEVSCSTIEQMGLVNTLCWAKSYAKDCENPLTSMEAVA